MLILDDEGKKVLDFVKEKTQIFDESHDWHHAVEVAENAIKILNRKDVLYLALLHDVCDHKYPESIPRSELSLWINENLKEYNYIDNLIDKVSFSYQIKHISEKLEKRDEEILEVVRSSDRKESLGKIGEKRLLLYSKRINRKMPEDGIKHCFDKLLRLVPEGFIKHIDKEVIDRHNVIVDYVNNNSDHNLKHLEFKDYFDY
jgi:HD superfamily phosphodiesterase